MDETKISHEFWESQYTLNNPNKQIDTMRRILNLPPITYKKAICLVCRRPFQAQYIGQRKVTHLCNWVSGCFPRD